MVTGIILSYLRGFLVPHERRSIVGDRKIKFTPRRQVCFGRDEKNLTCSRTWFVVCHRIFSRFRVKRKKKKNRIKKHFRRSIMTGKLSTTAVLGVRFFFFTYPLGVPFCKDPMTCLWPRVTCTELDPLALVIFGTKQIVMTCVGRRI